MQVLICYFFPKDICDFLDCYINWACFTVNAVLVLKMLLESFFGEKRGTTFIAKVFWLWITSPGQWFTWWFYEYKQSSI